MSSHASRVWMTSGRPRSWASAIWAANAVPLDVARRVVVVVVEPALADGDRPRAARRAGRTIVSTPWRRVVRVQPDGGPHAVVARPRRRAPPATCARSQPDRDHRRRRRPPRASATRRRRRPGSARRRGGSGCRSSSRSRRRQLVDAREQRRALGRPAGRRGSRPTRRRRAGAGRRPRRAGRCAPRSAWPVPGAPARRGRRRCAAPRGRRRARRRLRGRARPSTARWPRGRRWSPGSAATSPRGPRLGCDGVPRRGRAGDGVGGGRRRAGCRPTAPGRCRRTSCRRRWRRGRGGCRGCWRGRRCSGRPAPRSVKSPSLAVRRVGEHVVAEAVDADGVDEVERLDDVAGRLAHLLAADEQPAADGPALRRLDAGRHQHRRPVHAVEADDVLADEVVVDRPPLLEVARRRCRSRRRLR